jgi:hypothetical protein
MQPVNTAADFNKLEAEGSNAAQNPARRPRHVHCGITIDWKRTAVNRQCVSLSWGR